MNRMDEFGVNIIYFVDGVRHASRRRRSVPRKDDEVRLATGLYRVNLVVWVEDQNQDFDNHVAVDLVQIKD